MAKLSDFKKVKGLQDNFTGKTDIQFISKIEKGSTSVAMVTFAKGARTVWHSHGGEQTLIFMEGKGRVKIKGQKAIDAKPGDIIHIAKDKVHWHGAHPNEKKRMRHLAISNGKVKWLEAVDDKDYQLKK